MEVKKEFMMFLIGAIMMVVLLVVILSSGNEVKPSDLLNQKDQVTWVSWRG